MNRWLLDVSCVTEAGHSLLDVMLKRFIRYCLEFRAYMTYLSTSRCLRILSAILFEADMKSKACE